MVRAMSTFVLPCPGYGPLTFRGQPYEGHDHFLASNVDGHAIDLLCFLDSRGISAQFEDSLAQRLIRHAEQHGLRYLMICRPLELTTWATLVNFFALNAIEARMLVCNMGFVDFTPKKSEVLDDAVRQVEAHIGAGVAAATFLEETTRLSGETIQLYGMTYGEAYRQNIEQALTRTHAVVINSPAVDPRSAFPRPRPSSFFTALDVSNTFNRTLTGVSVVDLPVFDTTLTYDGVHYTAEGSRLIFDLVKELL
jgi:hypothetical protein